MAKSKVPQPGEIRTFASETRVFRIHPERGERGTLGHGDVALVIRWNVSCHYVVLTRLGPVSVDWTSFV